VSGFNEETPHWYYILREAQVQRGASGWEK
jgi:hypothetical protein